MGHTDGLGGAQTAYRELFDFVKNDGYEVKIINITDKKTHEQPFGSAVLMGLIEHKVSRLKKITKYWNLVLSGIRARYYKPDIFVSIGLSNSSNFITKFLPSNCFKIAQDFIADRSKEEDIWNLSRKNFDGIAVQAPSMLDYWKTTLTNPSGVNWLPCFPQPPVDGVLRSATGEHKAHIKLAYFGRLAGNKGLNLLFKSLAALPDSANLTLDVWGKGDQENYLKQLSKDLDLQHKVTFSGGYPANREGAELMASYDGLVLTSTEMEGLPLILLESMAYGLPFMATNIGAISDCCKDNPDTILVQPTQENITKGLSTLVSGVKNNQFDPVRLRQYYELNFSSAVMAARWKECFDNPKLFFA